MKYFLHDTSAFDDEKVSELFIKFGYEGLGLFYTILEKLGKQEKPVKTIVLKQHLKVGKKLEKCWKFMEQIGIISSNNGETFNKQLLNFSEKYQIKKEKTREKVSQWRKNQEQTENVTDYIPICNDAKVNKSKVKENKVINNTLLSEIKISDVPEENKQFYTIALTFHDIMQSYLTKLKIKSTAKHTYETWINTIRLMFENDKRTVEEFREVAEYLKKETPDNNGFSWQANIRSSDTLRKQFEKVLIKARQLKLAKKESGTYRKITEPNLMKS